MKPNTEVLFVEDDPALAMIVQAAMQAEGFTVRHCGSVAAARRAYLERRPDLIVLDVMLPGDSGFDLARQLRREDQQTPILFLTAKARVDDVVQGFRVGGNDYLRKPFSVQELIVRMQALTSATASYPPEDTEAYDLGELTFYPGRQELQRGAQRYSLTGTEAQLLQVLVRQPNQLVSKQDILQEVWGDSSLYHSRSLDVFISRLRKHLEQDAELKIINVRGRGYKLVV